MAAPHPLQAARRRPRWLVTVLAMAGSATYSFWWLWMSWRELKRITGDSSMRPFWHAAAMFLMPIYGLFRFHAHFRTLDELLENARVPVRAGAGLLTLVFFLLLSVLYGSLAVAVAAATSGSPASLSPISVVVAAAGYGYIVGTGQEALNAYYRSATGIAVPQRGQFFEYLFIPIFGIAFAAQVSVAYSALGSGF